MLQLRDVLSQITGVDVTSLPKADVLGLCCDSRGLSKGDLFFALSGSVDDGSRFIAKAQKGGALAVVCEAVPESKLDIPVIVVSDAREALAYAASNFYKAPTKGFYLCGVTGTNGKTTLTYLLEQIWNENACGVIGTVNIRYKGVVLDTNHTTPGPVELQSVFSKMKQVGVEYATIEVSSHALEQSRALGCEFDSVIFTNLTQDHLDYHGDMESYYQSKKKLFSELLVSSSKKDLLMVVNVDDEYGARLVSEMEGSKVSVKTFSIKSLAATLSVSKVDYQITGTRVVLNTGNGECEFVTSLIGEHNLKNLMAAILVGIHSGFDLDAVLSRLSHVHVPGRLDRVSDSNFFVDYAHTPDALVNVLQAVKSIMDKREGTGRLIAVFGCGGDRDKTKRLLMGQAAAKISDVALVTSDNPRTEDPDLIVLEIVPGVQEFQKSYNGTTGYFIEVDRRLALKKAVEIAGPDDVVVVAGKGHEDYQIIGTNKTHFDDREIVSEFLKMKTT